MEQFTLDFDVNGKNYIVIVQPYQVMGVHHYKAIFNDGRHIDFTQEKDGGLTPPTDGKLDGPLVNAVAKRILETVHRHNRDNGNSHSTLP